MNPQQRSWRLTRAPVSAFSPNAWWSSARFGARRHRCGRPCYSQPAETPYWCHRLPFRPRLETPSPCCRPRCLVARQEAAGGATQHLRAHANRMHTQEVVFSSYTAPTNISGTLERRVWLLAAVQTSGAHGGLGAPSSSSPSSPPPDKRAGFRLLPLAAGIGDARARGGGSAHLAVAACSPWRPRRAVPPRRRTKASWHRRPCSLWPLSALAIAESYHMPSACTPREVASLHLANKPR